MIPAADLDLEPPQLDPSTVSPALDRLARLFEEHAARRDGTARQCHWQAEDGWIVTYTTSRVNGGPFHDKFAVFAYKPIGRGARTGKASRWEAVYKRGFASRKSAKRRAVALYRQHSPKWSAAHPERPSR